MSKPETPLMTVDGKEVHPLVVASQRYTYARLGEELGHSNHSTVAIYVSRAKKRPKSTLIPAEWVLPLAKLLEVRPARLRKDLYLKDWEVPA